MVNIFGVRPAGKFPRANGNSGRFPFSQNVRKFRLGRKWKTFLRFVLLGNSRKKGIKARFSSIAILYHVTNSAAGVLEKPETGIRNRKGNAKVNRNRKRKRNGKRNLYKSRDNIYLNLS